MAAWERGNGVGMDPRLFTFLVCTFGGLLVGLLVKLFGDHNAIFADLMLEFGKTGRFDFRNAPGIVITAFVSLVAGASLGPEAPLADACGGMGTWMSDRLKLDEKQTRTMGYSGVSSMLAAFITEPIGGARSGSRIGAGRNQRQTDVFLGTVSKPACLGRVDGGLRHAQRGFLRDAVPVPGV